ncbi:MAG: hypothetical protein ACPLKX_00685 [Dictyoglomaceae bacterium]
MKKKILLILINIILLFSLSFGEVEIRSSLGILNEWKLNKWCPLFIQFKNLGNNVSLDLEIIFTQGLRFAGNSKTIYKQTLKLPSLSTRIIELLLPPIDFRYPVEIRVKSKDGSVNYYQKLEYNIERVILPLVFILGENRDLFLSFPPKTRIINVTNEKQLPTNYKAYDSADYVFIDYNFWQSLSPSKKNALRLFRTFEKRVFFFEELKIFPKSLNLTSSRIQFFPPSFLESPDLSIIDMQSFSYPNKLKILAFLSFYLTVTYLARRLIKNKKFLIFMLFLIIFLSSLISFFLGLEFKKDALVFGEKGLIYLSSEKEIAELYSHFVFFSPFKRDLVFFLPSNAIQIYQPFYQPQRNIGPLKIDGDERKAYLSLERNKTSYVECLSLMIFPIRAFYKIKGDNLEIQVENGSRYDIRSLMLTFEGKDFHLGDLKNQEIKTWNVSLKNPKKEQSLFFSLISQWKIKSDIIKREKIILWGKIENSLIDLKIERIKYNFRSENLLVLPLQ